MIPSDHFVRYYNEVFKEIEAKGYEELLAYWRELGRLQTLELSEKFREGGLQAAYDYWERIRVEENCLGKLKLTDEYFEFQMELCPSLSKVMDNDAKPCHHYCDHCMGWVQPTVEAAGLYVAHDIHSRTEPHCVLRVYHDKEAAADFEANAQLICKPYDTPASDGERSTD